MCRLQPNQRLILVQNWLEGANCQAPDIYREERVYYGVKLMGALVLTFLLSRLFRDTVFRGAAGSVRAVVPDLLTFLLAVPLYAFAFADGGPPQFLPAALLYGPAAAICLVIDVARRGPARPPRRRAK